jgi:hypothetical protein
MTHRNPLPLSKQLAQNPALALLEYHWPKVEETLRAKVAGRPETSIQIDTADLKQRLALVLISRPSARAALLRSADPLSFLRVLAASKDVFVAEVDAVAAWPAVKLASVIDRKTRAARKARKAPPAGE